MHWNVIRTATRRPHMDTSFFRELGRLVEPLTDADNLAKFIHAYETGILEYGKGVIPVVAVEGGEKVVKTYTGAEKVDREATKRLWNFIYSYLLLPIDSTETKVDRFIVWGSFYRTLKLVDGYRRVKPAFEKVDIEPAEDNVTIRALGHVAGAGNRDIIILDLGYRYREVEGRTATDMIDTVTSRYEPLINALHGTLLPTATHIFTRIYRVPGENERVETAATVYDHAEITITRVKPGRRGRYTVTVRLAAGGRREKIVLTGTATDIARTVQAMIASLVKPLYSRTHYKVVLARVLACTTGDCQLEDKYANETFQRMAWKAVRERDGTIYIVDEPLEAVLYKAGYTADEIKKVRGLIAYRLLDKRREPAHEAWAFDAGLISVPSPSSIVVTEMWDYIDVEGLLARLNPSTVGTLLMSFTEKFREAGIDFDILARLNPSNATIAAYYLASYKAVRGSRPIYEDNVAYLKCCGHRIHFLDPRKGKFVVYDEEGDGVLVKASTVKEAVKKAVEDGLLEEAKRAKEAGEAIVVDMGRGHRLIIPRKRWGEGEHEPVRH